MNPADLEKWLGVGRAHTIVKYGIVSTLLLSVVDILHTLPEEVSLIWLAEWKAGKVLYLLSRYNVLWTMGLVAFHSASSSMSVAVSTTRPALFMDASKDLQACWHSFVVSSVFVATSVAIAEAILYLRVFALAGPRRSVASALCAFFLAIHTGVFWFLAKFLQSLEYTISPFPKLIGCFPSQARVSNLSAVFGFIMFGEFAILIVTLWIVTAKYRQSTSRLVTTLYEDGLIYYALVTAVSVGNIICALVAPRGYINLLATLQQVLHSIFSSRMVLHIRELDRRAYGSSGDIALSAIDHGPFRFTTEESRTTESSEDV